MGYGIKRNGIQLYVSTVIVDTRCIAKDRTTEAYKKEERQLMKERDALVDKLVKLKMAA